MRPLSADVGGFVELAKDVGLPVAILGVLSWLLWKAYRTEVGKLRKELKELQEEFRKYIIEQQSTRQEWEDAHVRRMEDMIAKQSQLQEQTNSALRESTTALTAIKGVLLNFR